MVVARPALAVLLALLPLASAGRSTLRKQKSLTQKRQQPGEDDGDEYEYGDRESQVSHADAADFSVHQFLTSDDGRDVASSTDGDTATAMARSQAEAADDHFNSEDTPDASDSFAQTGKRSKKAQRPRPSLLETRSSRAKAKAGAKQMPGEEDEDDEYEYGDRESEVSHADAADFSVHQFLSQDDAREGAADTDDVKSEVAKSQAEEADDHFNSEDTPDTTDSFAQTGTRSKRTRSKQMPGDDGDEYEYGGRETEVSHADAADFSVHQFLAHDDAREEASSTEGDTATVLARNKALAAEDHFNSEDTPDASDSFAPTGKRSMRRAGSQQKARSSSKAGAKKQLPEDENDEDEYEYGDRESQVSHADASDFSVHQFLAQDDGRNGAESSDDPKQEIARESAEAADDHFNSEDTPDTTDSFAQTGRAARKSGKPLSP